MENIAFKTDLLRGAKGEKGDAGSTESVPTDGVLAYVGETTPQGYEEIQVSDIFTDIYADINAVKDIISDAYDPTATYAVGDYCIYNDTLYKCNTAIVTGEAFTPAKWDATNVADEVNEVKNGLADLNTKETITLTAEEGVTLENVAITKIGKVVIGSFRITLASDVAIFSVLARLSVSVAEKAVYPMTGGYVLYSDSNSSSVRTWQSLNAGSYVVQLVFFVTN